MSIKFLTLLECFVGNEDGWKIVRRRRHEGRNVHTRVTDGIQKEFRIGHQHQKRMTRLDHEIDKRKSNATMDFSKAISSHKNTNTSASPRPGASRSSTRAG
jgi:hypothetical protein